MIKSFLKALFEGNKSEAEKTFRGILKKGIITEAKFVWKPEDERKQGFELLDEEDLLRRLVSSYKRRNSGNLQTFVNRVYGMVTDIEDNYEEVMQLSRAIQKLDDDMTKTNDFATKVGIRNKLDPLQERLRELIDENGRNFSSVYNWLTTHNIDFRITAVDQQNRKLRVKIENLLEYEKDNYVDSDAFVWILQDSGNPQFDTPEFTKSLKALFEFAKSNFVTYYNQQMNTKTFHTQKNATMTNINQLIERYGGGIRITDLNYDSITDRVVVDIEYEK